MMPDKVEDVPRTVTCHVDAKVTVLEPNTMHYEICGGDKSSMSEALCEVSIHTRSMVPRLDQPYQHRHLSIGCYPIEQFIREREVMRREPL